MIETFNIGTTLVAYTRIISDASAERRRTNDGLSSFNDGLSSRNREKEAVAQIIRHVAGDGAALSHNAEGAPLLPGYNISVSHSRQLAVVAFDRERKIGIDAEEWRPTLMRVASRFLSEQEAALFTSPAQILKAWTAKEAVYKIIGHPAVDFQASIALSPDLSTAICCGNILNLLYFPTGETLITLATKSQVPLEKS